MYTLYERFIQQVKDEQIKKYNENHRDYLIRCGKLTSVKGQKQNARQKNKPVPNHPRIVRNNQENQEEIMRDAMPNVVFDNRSDQRPLKGAANYNFEQAQEKPNSQFDKPLKQTKVAERKSLNEQLIHPQARKNAAFQPQAKLQIKPTKEFSKPQEKVLPKYQNIQSEQLPDQFEEIVLAQCPQGCGKKFKQSVLQKHIKLCQKGQKKRKVFKVKIVDEEAEKLKKSEQKQEQKKPDAPKWKNQSNQLRIAMNLNKSGLAGEVPISPPPDDRTECPGCGRKFNEDAAAKHIPKCVQRNKGKK